MHNEVNMKILLGVVVLLSIVGSLLAENGWIGHLQDYNIDSDHHHVRSYHRDDNNRRYYQGHYPEHYANHDHDHIERPCSIHDVNCIRNFFAKNSKCTPTYGPAPDPYIIEESIMDIPHANLTITTYNAKHVGFNTGKFKEFYINKKTGTLVVEVEFDNFVVDSPKTVMTYYRKGKEPVQASDFSKIEYGRHSNFLVKSTFKRGQIVIKCNENNFMENLSLTLSVPYSHDIKPSEGHVFLYFSVAHPPFKMGPGLYGKKALNMKWYEELGLSSREALVARGSQIMAVFLQSKICDFRH